MVKPPIEIVYCPLPRYASAPSPRGYGPMLFGGVSIIIIPQIHLEIPRGYGRMLFGGVSTIIIPSIHLEIPK